MLSAYASACILAYLGLVSGVNAGVSKEEGLKSIKHLVFLMQENRPFDHYYGTMAGVRGFKDPNINTGSTGKKAFYQLVNDSMTLETKTLLPWYLGYNGTTNSSEAIQCTSAGSNNMANNHAALGPKETNDLWAEMNTPYSIGYFKREDIPTHFAIQEGWTTGDMYFEGIMSSTHPNRVMWNTGTINIPGSNVNSTQGPVLDNRDVAGCGSIGFSQLNGTTGRLAASIASPANYSCYPLDWKTVPEYLEDSGIDWKFFQAFENFGTNVMNKFVQYQTLWAEDKYNPLVVKALEYQHTENASSTIDIHYAGGGDWRGGLEAFKKAAAAGTLPPVSYIYPPDELSEHPPYLPRDGAWFQRETVEAFTHSPLYNESVLFINYDETGGYYDHVVPYHPPNGTPGESFINPFTEKETFSGPGFRVPHTIISPWTRGGVVFTPASDHISHILFLEKWAAAHGKPFHVEALTEWRRKHMDDLTDVFDFEHPDYSLPHIPSVEHPHTTNGDLDGAEYCADIYASDLIFPAIPYDEQSEATSLVSEAGFKTVRGQLTEGRFLVFEHGKKALSFARGKLASSNVVSKKHEAAKQRLVLEAINSKVLIDTRFKLRFESAGSHAAYVTSNLSLGNENAGAYFHITFTAGEGYTVQETHSKKYLTIADGKTKLSKTKAYFDVYSVSF